MLYFVERQSDKYIKIGITKNFYSRIRSLRNEYGDMELIGWMEGYLDLENVLHRKFSHLREYGEFFRPAKELLDYIEEHACPVHHSEWESQLYAMWANSSKAERTENVRLMLTRIQNLEARNTELVNENLQLKFDNQIAYPDHKPRAAHNVKNPTQPHTPLPVTQRKQQSQSPRNCVEEPKREVATHVIKKVVYESRDVWRDKLLDSIEADINLIRKQLGLPPIDTSGYKEAS